MTMYLTQKPRGAGINHRNSQRQTRFKATALILTHSGQSRRVWTGSCGGQRPWWPSWPCPSCPLAEGQGSEGVSASDKQVTVWRPCLPGKADTCLWRGSVCLLPEPVDEPDISRIYQGPRKPLRVLHLLGISGVHCSPDRGWQPGWAENDGALQLVLSNKSNFRR